MEKMKVTKIFQAFKGYGSSYNIEILNFFNLRLWPKDGESVIENKVIDLLSGLKGFKFVAIDTKRH